MAKKPRRVSKKEKILLDTQLQEELDLYLEAMESLKKKPSDYFYIKTYYFDENGKFISAKKYRELERQGKNVRKKNVFILKTDLPEFNLKAGDKVPDDIAEEILDHVREKIRYHNTIVGVMIRHDLSWFEAKRLVDEYFKLYEEGVIDSRDLHELFSP